ncbi:MAG: hypothetical protein KDA96_04445 [Planctomycetaceae bacterium]|nr:hypothetical protein [Planctomycetaceae bacterium]
MPRLSFRTAIVPLIAGISVIISAPSTTAGGIRNLAKPPAVCRIPGYCYSVSNRDSSEGQLRDSIEFLSHRGITTDALNQPQHAANEVTTTNTRTTGGGRTTISTTTSSRVVFPENVISQKTFQFQSVEESVGPVSISDVGGSVTSDGTLTVTCQALHSGGVHTHKLRGTVILRVEAIANSDGIGDRLNSPVVVRQCSEICMLPAQQKQTLSLSLKNDPGIAHSFSTITHLRVYVQYCYDR